MRSKHSALMAKCTAGHDTGGCLGFASPLQGVPRCLGPTPMAQKWVFICSELSDHFRLTAFLKSPAFPQMPALNCILPGRGASGFCFCLLVLFSLSLAHTLPAP